MIKRIGSYVRRNRAIVTQFIKRETISKYKGSYLGFVWSVLTPLLMLVVYSFVFGEIFQARWHSDSSTMEFAIIIFCGLATYNLFSEVVGRSPHLITSNPNYVKKVVFPLETFPVIATGSALITAGINFLLAIIFQGISGGLHWTLVLLPIVLLPLILFTLGISWILASLGVYLRDIGQVIGVAVQALMLLSPIFYSIDAIPERFKWFYEWNPISFFVNNVRDVIVWGNVPDSGQFLLQFMITAAVAVVGLYCFRKTKHGFADVL